MFGASWCGPSTQVDLALARHAERVLGHAAGLAEGAGDLWGGWGERHSLLAVCCCSRRVGCVLDDRLLCKAATLICSRCSEAVRFAGQQPVVEECSEHLCTRMRVVCVELIASKGWMTRLHPARKAQPRLDSFCGCKGGFDGKVQRPEMFRRSQSELQTDCIAAAVDLAQRRARI